MILWKMDTKTPSVLVLQHIANVPPRRAVPVRGIWTYLPKGRSADGEGV